MPRKLRDDDADRCILTPNEHDITEQLEQDFSRLMNQVEEDSPAAYGTIRHQAQEKSMPSFVKNIMDSLTKPNEYLQDYLQDFSSRLQSHRIQHHEYLLVTALGDVAKNLNAERKKNIELLSKIIEFEEKTLEQERISSQKRMNNKLAKIRKNLKNGKLTPGFAEIARQGCKSDTVQKNMISCFKIYCSLNSIQIADDIDFQTAMEFMKNLEDVDV